MQNIPNSIVYRYVYIYIFLHIYMLFKFFTCICGRGGMIWENGIKTCIISYKKRITSPGSMQNPGSLGLLHWDDPEGWYGKGDGRGFRMGNMCTSVADAC